MYEVTLEDKEHAIIGVKWESHLTPEAIHQANEEIDELLKKHEFTRFHLIVNMRDVVVFKPETQKEIVAHQEWLMRKGMDQAAVVVKSNVARLQLKRTAKEASHDTETHFTEKDEALDFLKQKNIG
ncbi:STAS/SEC14 domain-containing protein [Shouchella sp. 1P09AA]|uniref:STAS/SEC14 domain-containing protein n=1 Tax=unclassified Shouchella TaxID=2893065 RepID=UPI0039A1BB5C